YLNKLEQCLLGEAIPELAELVQPGIYNMRFAKELTVGQEAIRIMIDRALEKHSSPGETWLEFILKLTGDPRPAVEGTTNHRKWWSTLKEHRRQALIRWLAIDDIKLFLEILRDHADHASAEILRMFVPRKNFLEKLIETKLIQSARLFLSKEAHAYVRRKFTDRVLKYARIKSGEQSFIYLDLGKVHMVEGTHNASVRLYSKLPPKSRLADYRSEVFGANEIRPNSEDTIVHSGSWQIKLVFHLLQYGLDVSFEDLLVEDDWWEYRRKYGVGEFDSEVREENYWDYFDD
ncbi:MAG: hypothetical protein H3C47_15865, partial [Candidatus Cloacimonetes bacterium]|nr:hypothetical protein [Candidatus Cloacimonadota bacterium]